MMMRAAVGCLTLAFAVSAGACAGTRKPEDAVQKILELRSRNCTSTADYAPYVSTELAGTFAEDSAMRDPESSPVPRWKAPKVSAETTSGVEVEVEWLPAENYPGWPASTIFILEKFSGRWMLVDARDGTPAPASAETTAPSSEASGSSAP